MVLKSRDGGHSWEKICNLEENLWDSLLGRFVLYQRLTRRRVHNIIPNSFGSHLLVTKNRFYILDKEHNLRAVSHSCEGSRPLREAVIFQEEDLIYGEYSLNPNRDIISVIKSNLSASQPLYSFDSRRVRHIHALQYDPFEGNYWIATGDEDNECMIGVFSDDFQRLDIIGEGSQQWRTVNFVFAEDAVFWGTDDPDGQNAVYSYDRSSGGIRHHFDVEGPIYYSRRRNNIIILGTTVENKYKTKYGHLYLYDFLIDKSVVGLSLEKDNLHPHLFGYGIFEFAHGEGQTNRFWVAAKGFKGGLKSYLCEICYE